MAVNGLNMRVCVLTRVDTVSTLDLGVEENMQYASRVARSCH